VFSCIVHEHSEETASNCIDKASAPKTPGGNDQRTIDYYIREANAGKTVDGVTYDAKTRVIDVVVTDDGDGKLQAEVRYGGEGEPTFTNRYQPPTTEEEPPPDQDRGHGSSGHGMWIARKVNTSDEGLLRSYLALLAASAVIMAWVLRRRKKD
jgi:pilin isopeptide linkage protein